MRITSLDSSTPLTSPCRPFPYPFLPVQRRCARAPPPRGAEEISMVQQRRSSAPAQFKSVCFSNVSFVIVKISSAPWERPVTLPANNAPREVRRAMVIKRCYGRVVGTEGVSDRFAFLKDDDSVPTGTTFSEPGGGERGYFRGETAAPPPLRPPLRLIHIFFFPFSLSRDESRR